MKLIAIPKDKYDSYKLSVMFSGYKWDPVFLDKNTISRHVLVITRREHDEISALTEALDKETVAAEELLNTDGQLCKALRLPRLIRKQLPAMRNYSPEQHIRLMRYDFHPADTPARWAVSEVNSDVPGGFAEASIMPRLAADCLRESDGADNPAWRYIDFGDIFAGAIAARVRPRGRIAFIHCTSYSDDRQVMQIIGDRLSALGYSVIYAASDHLKFEKNKAICLLDAYEGRVDAIVRFTPLEWLIDVKPRTWQGYFDTLTLSCNHPVAIFAQTKRFPLVWGALEERGLGFDTWRRLMPETFETRDAHNEPDIIYKPAWGRVGEKITIREACSDEEYNKLMRDVHRHPKSYVAQKRFHSLPLTGIDGGSYHVCLGSYTIDGRHAGYYARLSATPRIDSNAEDLAVLIEGDADDLGAPGASDMLRLPQPMPPPSSPGFEAFKIWAPPGARWNDWVRPVPFLPEPKKVTKGTVRFVNIATQTPQAGLEQPAVAYIDELSSDTAIFLDLPGKNAIEEGLALAKLGYRPVPLYNGTNPPPGAMGIIDNRPIEEALIAAAWQPGHMKIADDAPPVFLLDSDRTHRFRMSVAIFDNSWDLYEQDAPTAGFLCESGISKVIVRSSGKVSRDLAKILYKYQQKGIAIHHTDGSASPRKITIKKPPKA